MDYRKLFLSVILLIFCGSAMYGAELSASQKKFQTTILQFIKEEGFSPYIDDDNSVTFKKEGTLYWITVSEENPFYVEFHRAGFNNEDGFDAALILASNEATKNTKCTKIIIGEKSVSIVIEMFCHSAEEFKYVFYRNMSALADGYKRFVESYADLSDDDEDESLPFSFISAEVANVKKDDTIIADYGKSIYDFNSRYLKPKITLDVHKAGSYEIYVKMYKNGTLTTGSSSPSGYSFSKTISMSTGKHSYELSGWGSDTPGHWDMGDYKFEFYYDGKLIGSKSFKVY